MKKASFTQQKSLKNNIKEDVQMQDSCMAQDLKHYYEYSA